MEKISFSSMNIIDAGDLEQFHAQSHIEVECQYFDWDQAWSELLNIALYNQGPELSEIGSTWLGSLIEMNAISPMSARIISPSEMERSFYRGAYMGVVGMDEKTIWGVPWFTDTRVIYYRRSWLEKAGVHESDAFKDSSAFKTTLKKLQNYGMETPLTMPTADLNVIYNAASWVWNAGGNFRTKDGRSLLLNRPEAQAGLLEYFSFHHFLSHKAQGLKIVESDNLFREGEAATTISGPWLLSWVKQDEKYFSDVGIAKVPGIPFVGGTHLVVWAHCLSGDSVVQKFVQFLTSIETQRKFVQKTALLPARIEVLNSDPFVRDPFYRIFAESLSTGQVFTISHRWAAVEQRLMGLFSSLWADLAKNPELDLRTELKQRTDALINRLDNTILAKI